MMESEKNKVIMGTYDHNEYLVLKLLIRNPSSRMD